MIHKRRSVLSLFALMLAVLICLANADEVCGVWGYVYNHNGTKAGTDFYTIHVIRLDESGTSGYYYRPFDSYFNVGCGQGLVAGDWFLYAETNENGTHYYSNGYAFYDWYPHVSLGQHDQLCTRTTPPAIPYEQKK